MNQSVPSFLRRRAQTHRSDPLLDRFGKSAACGISHGRRTSSFPGPSCSTSALSPTSAASPSNCYSHLYLRMLILGAPGAGKGTQVARMMKTLPIDSIGVGDLLRQEIRQKSELGKTAENYMKKGMLLPDQVILNLVEPQMVSWKNRDWILDGFPRTRSQCVLLDQSLLQRSTDEINLVVNLDVSDDVILNRIENRWIHAPSGRVYNTTFSPPLRPGVDDTTGEPLTKRPDDTAEVFKIRLDDYHRQNLPILDHYSQQTVNIAGIHLPKLVTLEGLTSDEIWPKLLHLIGERYPHLGEVVKS